MQCLDSLECLSSARQSIEDHSRSTAWPNTMLGRSCCFLGKLISVSVSVRSNLYEQVAMHRYLVVEDIRLDAWGLANITQSSMLCSPSYMRLACKSKRSRLLSIALTGSLGSIRRLKEARALSSSLCAGCSTDTGQQSIPISYAADSRAGIPAVGSLATKSRTANPGHGLQLHSPYRLRHRSIHSAAIDGGMGPLAGFRAPLGLGRVTGGGRPQGFELRANWEARLRQPSAARLFKNDYCFLKRT